MLGNLNFLVFGVTGNADHFHAVQQRAGDGFELVRGGDEHHLREVDRHFQVVIAELSVLFGVEHFQQGGSRIAAEIGAELVDLVQHEDRVERAYPAQRLDDAPGHRTDIGAAVTADFGFIMDAAQRHAHELAPQRAGDRLAEGGLANTRRADEAQDDAFALAADEIGGAPRRAALPCVPGAACARPGIRGCVLLHLPARNGPGLAPRGRGRYPGYPGCVCDQGTETSQSR